MINKFETKIVNLEALKSFDFSIPTYQRPYVWGQEQIDKLLSDFYLSFKTEPESEYFIGNILTKENEDHAELIDGQQRFTTLWLTSYVISRKAIDSSLKEFLMNTNGSLKMSFEIRTEVAEYFSHLTRLDAGFNTDTMSTEEIQKHPYLKNISSALVTIDDILDKIDKEDLRNFGDYIYRNVKFVKNTTPKNIDLNKLFSTINSSGVQLEQTDILKANLLKRIENKILYGKLWETCENMNNFFERNARDSFNISPSELYNMDFRNLVPFSRDRFYLEDHSKSDDHKQEFRIDNIHYQEIQEYKREGIEQKEERESDEIYCRSIINFGQLLLHTYRIHLQEEGKADFEGTFHVNRLLEIFKPLQETSESDEIIRFLERLWILRQLFDKYVIKWISDLSSKSENLELVNINRSDESRTYSRSKFMERTPTLMLQSVLYFTGDYLRQFWLTSYLGYLFLDHKNRKANDPKLLTQLERIDNQLSLCTSLADKDASLRLLTSDIPSDRNLRNELMESSGTGFRHYWFQKLEYVLFKNWRFEETKEFKNYRITSRNSVEHIYPQHPENPIKYPSLMKDDLDSFGNLVLLSISQNSEYSNRSVDQKHTMFKDKNVYDTLKSFFIFNQYEGQWGPDNISKHREEMIQIIEEHYRL